MLTTIEKTIILSGSLFGSVFIFTNSLNCINNIALLKRYYNNVDETSVNKLIIINGITMLFSGLTFSYFIYNATK
jgi:hypothetical protein